MLISQSYFLIMEKKDFLDRLLRCFSVFEGCFDRSNALSGRLSMTPIFLCSTLNFGLLDNQVNAGGISVVFLYRPETDNLNFYLC